MSNSPYKWLAIEDFTGGRNAVDDPCSLKPNQVVEMRNGDTYRTHLFRKRPGSAAPAIGTAFTGIISSLIAHFPNNNPAAAELWGVDDATPPVVGRMAAASTFTAVTLKDALSASTDGVKVRGCTYGGKLFLAYPSAQDRLHVYDPTLAAPSVRRTGQAVSAAPTVADQTGGGTYATTLRYYRVRTRIKNGSIVVAQSEPSPSVAFTPDGSHVSARVTKPASISESETHWVVEGSIDNAIFNELSEIVLATTTYDDTAAPSSYSTLPLSPTSGSYANWTSVKYVLAAFNRVFGIGSHTSGAFQSRLYYSTAKGTSDKGDDERVPNALTVKNYVDLDEGIGGDATGLAGPLYESIFAFKYSQIRKITPTGGSGTVFDTLTVSPALGALDQECIALGEDAGQRPCIFFLDSQVGPCIVGPVPATPIGDHGVRDSWDSVNLAATTRAGLVANYKKLGQVWFWWCTGAANEPNVLAIYTKATGGWQICDTGGKIRLARAVALFARTPGASMSRDLVPYVSYQATANKLLRCDTTDTDDAGTSFQALVKTRPIIAAQGKAFRATTPWILAKAAAGVTLTVTFDLDFGRVTQSCTIDLTLLAEEGAATRVWRRAAGIDLSGGKAVQVQVGDAAAAANAWTIERIYLPLAPEDEQP
jgi:hypothetical protein